MDVKNSHEYVIYFGMCDIYVRPILRFLRVRILHKYRILDEWKTRNIFVTHMNNSCEFFTRVKNLCEFFTRMTDSLEFESPTNLSHVWNIRTYLSILWIIRANSLHVWIIRTNSSQVWKIRTRDVWQIHHKRMFVMRSYLSEVCNLTVTDKRICTKYW